MSPEVHIEERSLIERPDGRRKMIVGSEVYGGERILFTARAVRIDTRGTLALNGTHVRNLAPEELSPEKMREVVEAIFEEEVRKYGASRY